MGDLHGIQSVSRYTSLDGLRGLAALVVLLHHCALVSPHLADAVESNGVGPFEPWVWWATFTPLHLIWAGKEAVYLFFVLSGFVLTLPFVSDSRPDWAAYFRKRVVRIYLPVWAALVFALWMASVFARTAESTLSIWVNLHDEVPDVARDALLLRGAGSLNSPLWSLQWEMAFSLILPLFVVAAVRFRRVWLLCLFGLVVLISVGDLIHMSGPVYLLIFGVGSLMAAQRDLLLGWAQKTCRGGWAIVVSASLFLLCVSWVFPQQPVDMAAATIGGALLVYVFLGAEPAIHLGRNSAIHWLGIRSFSIYLVHEPIVVSVAFHLHLSNPLLVAVISVPLSLVTAEAFFRLVERPSHMLAGRAGDYMGRKKGLVVAGSHRR